MSCYRIPELDLYIYQGDSKTFRFRYSAGGEPVDISSYVIRLECKANKLSRDAVILDQTTNKGEYTFEYSPEDTVDSKHHKVKYEVVFWVDANTKNTKYKGSLVITREYVT